MCRRAFNGHVGLRLNNETTSSVNRGSPIDRPRWVLSLRLTLALCQVSTTLYPTLGGFISSTIATANRGDSTRLTAAAVASFTKTVIDRSWKGRNHLAMLIRSTLHIHVLWKLGLS